jgi:hypothetical protein
MYFLEQRIVRCASAAICFSWSRSIINNPTLQEFANLQGQRSFFAAIIFLIGSGFKFTIIHIDKLFPFLSSSAITIIKIIFSPIIGLAFGMSLSLTFWILFRISLKLWENYDFNKK